MPGQTIATCQNVFDYVSQYQSNKVKASINERGFNTIISSSDMLASLILILHMVS